MPAQTEPRRRLRLGARPYSSSVGKMASDLYAMKNGMKPVERLGVVRRLHNTDGTSAAHCPVNLLSRSKMQGLTRYRIMPLARSTCPFVRGCATEAQSTRMLKLSQNSRNFYMVNCALLSAMIALGTPKR